jgi:chromosome segregation ATPase
MNTTRLGKILVFVNLFLGIGLFAWALSLYGNRLDYFDRKDADPPVEGRFTTLQNEVKKASETVATAQRNFAEKAEQLRRFEGERDRRLARLTARITQVRAGNAPNILFRQQVLLADPRFPGLINVDQDGPVVKGVRNNDLQGLGFLQNEMNAAVREQQTLANRIAEARKRLEELSTRVEAVQVEVFKQKDIRGHLVEQKDYLADVQVNWDERLRVLERRKAQLEARLAQLGVPGKVGRADK